jgi:hypothetical protein
MIRKEYFNHKKKQALRRRPPLLHQNGKYFLKCLKVHGLWEKVLWTDGQMLPY